MCEFQLFGSQVLAIGSNCDSVFASRTDSYSTRLEPLVLSISFTPLLSRRNTLRVTLSAALSSQDGAVGSSVHLGKKGKDFEFSHLPLKVEFLECSARGSKGEEGDSDMESLEKSLAKL